MFILKKYKLASVSIIISALFLAGIIYHISRDIQRVTIICFNDLSSRWEPLKVSGGGQEERLLGGLPALAALVSELKTTRPNILLFEAGDMISGSAWRLFKGRPEFEAANLMGVDAGTLGDHEFSQGLEGLKAILAQADFPLLAANVVCNDSGLAPRLQSGVVLETGDKVKVGVFGLAPPGVCLTHRLTEELEALNDDLVVAQRMVGELRRQGAQIIVALTHQGLEADKWLAGNVSGIHLIIGAHSHTPTWEPVWAEGPDGWKSLIVQAAPEGQSAGLLELTVTRGRVARNLTYWRLIEAAGDGPGHPQVAALIAQYQARLPQAAETPLGVSLRPADATQASSRTTETGLGNFLAEALRWKLDTDIALLNSGGIRGDRRYPPGGISLKTIQEILPSNNTLWRVGLSGRQIRDTLEIAASALKSQDEDFLPALRTPGGGFLQIAGLRVQYDLSPAFKPALIDNEGRVLTPGNRVRQVAVLRGDRWEPLDDNELYTAAVLTRAAEGGDKHVIIKRAESKTKTMIKEAEAVMDYLHGPLGGVANMAVDGRILITGETRGAQAWKEPEMFSRQHFSN